ncbi:FAD-binding protein [Streptomyces sp. SCL15-4]|uniref:FAD-binding protein n=1 Tax=Streptomyces sp. SCL15-4 TaxID=2967221 RepID=UPI002966FC25|nr:FAD-binding protein [Streptomyces sp. SCL15-4]
MANWAGNVVYQAPRVHRPASLDELRALVARSDRIRALGTGHSFSRVADSTGDLVRLDALPPLLEVDSARRTVTVGAGMRYADLTAALHRAGFALPNLASLPHISVAGCVATATHGSGDGNRCLSASVRALELIAPDGESTVVDRESHPDTFAGSVVALGALGIATRVTLDVVDTFEVAQRVRVDVPLDEIGAHLDEVFAAAYSVSVFTDWHGERASVWLKQRVGATGSGWAGGRAATRLLHPVPGMPPGGSTEQLGVPGPWFERLPHFRPDLVPGAGEELQSEYYLPRAAAAQAVAALRGIGGLLQPLLHIAEVRTVRGDDLWLSPAYRQDSVTFHFTWIDNPAVRTAIAAVEEILTPLGARPHWGKLTLLPPARVAARYERAADFGRLRAHHDPGGKFGNAFVEEMFPLPS